MAAEKLPAIDHLSKLEQDDLCTILDRLFEPSVDLRDLCIPRLYKRSLTSYDDLISSVKADLEKLLVSSSTDTLDRILASHPRLGETHVTSAQSRAEQAQLQSSDGTEAQRLQAMNQTYEQTFPGLRYVVFVNGRSRSAILADMQARVDRSDGQAERSSAVDSICAIASDRARKLAPT